VGLVLELADLGFDMNDTTAETEFECVLCSVGDIKTMLYSPSRNQVSDLTPNARPLQPLDAEPGESGGRLGFFHNENVPDLRNLQLSTHTLKSGDVLLCSTDGIYDNLDPEFLGVLPTTVDPHLTPVQDSQDPPCHEWDLSEAHQLKNKFRCDFLREHIIKKAEEATPEIIAQNLVQHCFSTTVMSREFIEAHPQKFLPRNFLLYPGKMDHATLTWYSACACMAWACEWLSRVLV
jgi:hypothetical protein